MAHINEILKESDNKILNYTLKKINYFLKVNYFELDTFCEFNEIDFNISPYDFSGREIEIAFIEMFNKDPHVETHQFYIEKDMWKGYVRVYQD